MGRKTHGPILVAAIEHGDFEKVREVLLTHIKTKQRIQELCTSEVRRLASDYTEIPLLLAASLPDPTILQFLVNKQEVNINYVHKEVVKRKTKVKTALIIAVRSGLVSTVDAILAMNADPNLQDHKLRTALHHAVRKADYRMAKMLLTRGAQPNIVDAAGNTPLHTATIFGHTELVKLLVKHDSDMFKKGTSGAIPIHMAAKEGHNALVKLFCEYDVNVNTKVPCYDNREKAPIHVAAEEGHAETVAILLHECGAEPNLRDSMGETPLHCACLREYDPMGMKSKDEYTETVKVLLNAGAHIDLQNSRGETPLHLATRNEFQKTVELLIHAGSDPTIEDNAGYKPYDLATADDTVTIQILKAAMEERMRIMNDALEVQAKGYSTSLIKPSVSSRSAVSVTSIGSNEFILASGGRNGSNAIYDDGYLKPIGLRSRSNTKGSSLTGSSQDLLGKSQSTSSSGSKPAFSRGKKKSQSLLPQFRVKADKAGLDRSADSHPSNAEPRAKENSLSSPSDSSQKMARSLPKPPVEMREEGVGRQRANKAGEVDSFWDVTPRVSTASYRDDDAAADAAATTTGQGYLHQSYESLPDDDVKPLANKGRGRRPPQRASPGKKAIQIQAAFPNANKIPGSPAKNGLSDSDDDDTYFDDASFDTLDTLSDRGAPEVPPKPAKYCLDQQRANYTPDEKRKIQSAVSNQSLHSWLEEQAEIIQRDGLTGPPSGKQPNADENDEFSVTSEISSVSKTKGRSMNGQRPAHMVLRDKEDEPPPLPPKPGTRVPSQEPQQRQRRQQQVQQVTAPVPTIIRVIPKQLGRVSPVSESTSITEHTEPYGTGYYDSLNSRMTTEESESMVTDSTVLHPAANRRPLEGGQKYKMSDGREAISSTNEESSDNTNWERVPVNHASNLYWEHTDSTRGIFDARKESRKKTQQVRPSRGRQQASTEADSSDSLSWHSSDDDDDDDETTVVSQQASHVMQGNKVAQLRQNLELDLSKSFVKDHRGQRSMDEAETTPGRGVQAQRRLIGEQSPSSVSQGYLQHQNRTISSNARAEYVSRKDNGAMVRTGSVEVIDMQQDLDVISRRTKSVQELDSDGDPMGQRKVTIGKETVIPDAIRSKRPGSAEHRIVRYDANGKQPLKIVGGNATGVFVHEIQKKSEAASQCLMIGDQILKLNNRSTRNMTREDVYAVLKGIKNWVRMVVVNDPDAYQSVVSNDGAGDSFFAKAHFGYDASNKAEFSFKAGDVFAVRDTAPSGKPGVWRVARIAGTPGQEKTGFIPNKFRADQIATSCRIAELRAEEIRGRGGTFRRGFKRAKSLDRGMNKVDTDDFREALKTVKSYEWVKEKAPSFKKPVVLLGLFCDSVRDLLLSDQPGQFALPKGAVELSTNAPGDDPAVPPVNIRPIEVVMTKGKHCLLIMTPANIKYLQEHTHLSPIVVYLCPANKAIVKSLKARFAPGFERKASFMYDEAIQFSKRHGDLFSDTVYYASDGEWLKNLKDSITRLQNQPIWVPLEGDDDSASSDEHAGEDDGDVAFPVQPQPFRQALIRPEANDCRRGRQAERMSKTTDDLPDVPDEIRDVLKRHIGAASQQGSRPRHQPVDDALGPNGLGARYQDHLDEESTMSGHSALDTSHSSNSGGSKPKRSILKNKSQSTLDESSAGDADSVITATSSSSSFRPRPRHAKSSRGHGRAIVIERADQYDRSLREQQQQQQQQPTQQTAARYQYMPQKRETPL